MQRRMNLADVEEDLRRFDRMGLTLAQQATRLGVTPRSIERGRAALGLSKGKSPMVEITPEIDALLKQAAKDGWSREEAYRTTGVSHRRLARLYPDIFMEPAARGEAAALARQENRIERGLTKPEEHRSVGGSVPFRWPVQ